MNIVIILSDEQRWDTPGCYGQSTVVTPNLDRMAVEGVRFANAFTCQPLCGPARSCIQTGLYASETGCSANSIALPQGVSTVADYLAEAGYETAYIGKWHLASNAHEGDECYWTRPIPPERRGGWRDYWLAADVPEYTSHSTAGWLFDGEGRKVELHDQYRADAYTDFAIDYLRERRGDRPLALMLSLVEPHAQPYHRLYQGPPTRRTRHEYREITYEGPDHMVAQFADAPLPPDLEAMPGQAHEFWPDYLAACARVDWNVGRLLDTLAELCMSDDTCVFYTSDHGCHFFSHRPTVAKCTHHESSIRIPMIARGPGFTGGETVEALVSLIDLAPTVLHAAGLSPPSAMRGRPLSTRWHLPLTGETASSSSFPVPGGHVCCAPNAGNSSRGRRRLGFGPWDSMTWIAIPANGMTFLPGQGTLTSAHRC